MLIAVFSRVRPASGPQVYNYLGKDLVNLIIQLPNKLQA